MACYISKRSSDASNVLGSSVNSVTSFGYFTLGFSGSGLSVNTLVLSFGNAAADYSPILKSDISEQL